LCEGNTTICWLCRDVLLLSGLSFFTQTETNVHGSVSYLFFIFPWESTRRLLWAHSHRQAAWTWFTGLANVSPDTALHAATYFVLAMCVYVKWFHLYFLPFRCPH
jgi:hypothetical protein